MNIQKLMQQAQEMERKMKDMQALLAAREVTGRSGGGLVSVVLAGDGSMVSISIDPSLLKADEKEVLEDLVKVAYNDARARKDEMVGDETSKVFGGMGLPGGLKLPV